MTVPSTSPENCYWRRWEEHSVTLASTMDISLLKELSITSPQPLKSWTLLIWLQRQILESLPPYKIGGYGHAEWYFDYQEADVHHRHVSHLYGLHPGCGSTIGRRITQACAVSLNRRGDEVLAGVWPGRLISGQTGGWRAGPRPDSQTASSGANN